MPKPFIDTPRPVWITEQEAEIAAWLYRRWDAAPADAAEAAKQGLAACYELEHTENQVVWEGAHAMLRALGMPDS